MEKTRILNVLGLNVGDHFKFRDGEYYVFSGNRILAPEDEKTSFPGMPYCDILFGDTLIDMVNNPEEIHRIVKLTEKEKQICKVIGAKYVSRSVDAQDVVLWNVKPETDGRGFGAPDMGGEVTYSFGSLAKSIFPSVKEGDLVEVEGASEGETEILKHCFTCGHWKLVGRDSFYCKSRNSDKFQRQTLEHETCEFWKDRRSDG